MMVDQSEHGQPSKSRYRVIDRAGNRCCWVELQPLTGRTHQLRVHMAAIGHPIVGDGKYGGPDAFLSGSISRKLHLHARRLIIEHPDGTPLDVEAPLPDHMAASLAQLGFEESEGEYIPDPTGEWGREEKKAAAKAHAKDYRKERKGERRGRADTGRARNDSRKSDSRKSPGARPEAPRKSGPKKGLGSKPSAKPTGPRQAAKPAGKPAGRPAGKPSGRPPAPRGQR